MKINDRVRVMKKNEDNTWSALHRGVIVALTSAGATVYNPKDKPGDHEPGTSEWFAFDAPNIRIEAY